MLDENECNEALSLASDWILAAASAEQQGLSQSETNSLYESLQKAASSRQPMLDGCSSANFPQSAEGGMLPFCGSGHSSFAWAVRSNPKVKKVFERFYGTSH